VRFNDIEETQKGISRPHHLNFVSASKVIFEKEHNVTSPEGKQ